MVLLNSSAVFLQVKSMEIIHGKFSEKNISTNNALLFCKTWQWTVAYIYSTLTRGI